MTTSRFIENLADVQDTINQGVRTHYRYGINPLSPRYKPPAPETPPESTEPPTTAEKPFIPADVFIANYFAVRGKNPNEYILGSEEQMAEYETLLKEAQQAYNREYGTGGLMRSAGAKAVGMLPFGSVPQRLIQGQEPTTADWIWTGVDAALIGAPYIKAGVKQGLKASFTTAMNKGLDKWLARQGRAAGDTTIQRWLAKHPRIVQTATDSLVKRMAEKRGYQQAGKAAAEDTVRDIERLLVEEHPPVKGQTRSMAEILGGLEAKPPAMAGARAELVPKKEPRVVDIDEWFKLGDRPEYYGDLTVSQGIAKVEGELKRLSAITHPSYGQQAAIQSLKTDLSDLTGYAKQLKITPVRAELVPKPVPEVTGLYKHPPGPHEVPQFGEVGAVPQYTPEAASRRKVIEARLRRGEPVPEKLLAEFPDLAIPRAEAGMAKPVPEALPSTAEGITAPVKAITPLPAAGGAPPKPPKDWNKIKGSLWDRYSKAQPEPTPTVRPPLRETLTKAYRKGEQLIADDYARLNKLGWETELNAAMVRAAPGRAAEVYRETMVGVEQALGGNKNLVKYVDDYLMLHHQLEVMKATGRKTFALVKGGNVTRFTEKQIQLLFAQMKDTLGDKYEMVKQAASVVPNAYHELLRQSSEVTPEVAEGLIQKYPWYNPLIYEQEGSQAVTNLGKLSPSMIKQLTVYNVDKQPVTPLTALPNAIKRRMTANALNDAKKAIAHNALGTTEWGGKVEIVDKKPEGAFIDFFEDGQRKYLKLGKGAEWIAQDVELFKTQPKDAIRRTAKAINTVSRAAFTSLSPAFVVSNSIFDTLTAWFRESIKPWEIGQAAYHTVADLFAEDAVVNRFRAAGGDVGGFFFDEKKLMQEFLEADKAGNMALRNPKDTLELLKRYSNPFNLVKDLGHAGENAPRLATYKKALKEGVSEAEAALRARRVTVDFARMGQASKVINDYYLFFNAGVQGFLLPGRTLRDNPKSIMRLALFLSATIGLTAYNLSYDEYKDVPDSLKYGSLLIMLPSTKYDKYGKKVPKYITIIPTLREFSAFTAPIIYMLGKLSSKQPELFSSISEAFGYWYPSWSPLSMITGTMAGIQLPTQLGQTIQEIIQNRDTYRNQPIVDDEMAQLPPKEQYDDNTSKLAITIGQALNQSPKMVDFFINNMFGSTGRDAMYTISKAIDAIDGEQVDPRIAGLVKQLREIPTIVKPADIPLAREEFLNKLSVEDRDVVLNLERIPDDKIPFISNLIYRLYKERGGQVYQTARTKALAEGELETPQKALEGLQESALSNAEKFNAGKISKEQYDKERTRYRAYYSGARTAEWRQARLKGAVGISDVEKFIPEGWQRGKEEQALSDYYTIQDKYINKTEVLDSAAWRQIMKSTEQDLREKYPEAAVQYALTHVNDWIYSLPEPARSLELQRLQGIETGSWWRNYSGSSSGGGRAPSIEEMIGGKGATSGTKPSGKSYLDRLNELVGAK